MAKTNLNEDKIALLTGCFIFLLAALNLAHLDVLGWVVSTNMWTSMDKAFSATTGAYKGTISGVVSLLCTYVALTAILSFGIKLLGGNVARFVKSFTVVFFISEICYMFGANAHIAATPDAQAKFGIDWSIGLTTEAGFIVALVAGIFISNAFPRIAESLHDACRPELFVKIAIVVLGAELGVKAAAASGMAGTIIFRGLCAIVEAYLLKGCSPACKGYICTKLSDGSRCEHGIHTLSCLHCLDDIYDKCLGAYGTERAFMDTCSTSDTFFFIYNRNTNTAV